MHINFCLSIDCLNEELVQALPSVVYAFHRKLASDKKRASKLAEMIQAIDGQGNVSEELQLAIRVCAQSLDSLKYDIARAERVLSKFPLEERAKSRSMSPNHAFNVLKANLPSQE